MIYAINKQRRAIGQRIHANAAFVIVTLMALVLSGCISAKLIGDYDDTVDKGITDVQQKTELYFAKLNSAPATVYDQGFYDDITSRLAVLKTRATVLPQNEIIAGEIGTLQATFADLQKFDQITMRPIKSGTDHTTPFTNALPPIEASVRAILKLELAMKRGITTSDPQASTQAKN